MSGVQPAPETLADAVLAALDAEIAKPTGACQECQDIAAGFRLARAVVAEVVAATQADQQPEGERRSDYLLDGSPEAVAVVRAARGLPPIAPVEGEQPRTAPPLCGCTAGRPHRPDCGLTGTATGRVYHDHVVRCRACGVVQQAVCSHDAESVASFADALRTEELELMSTELGTAIRRWAGA